MRLKEIKKRMDEISNEIDELFKIVIWFDYRDVIIDMQIFLEEMIDNPNNEYKKQKNDWEDLHGKLEELITFIEEANIQFIWRITPKYNFYYYASTRYKIILKIIKEFSLLDKKVNTINNEISYLIECCQEVIDIEKSGFVEDYKIIAEDMITDLHSYTESLTPYNKLIEQLNEL